MDINGAQQKQLRKALLSAFPTRQDLEMMVSDVLNENLRHIAGDSNLEHTVFALIRWSMAKGRLEELVTGALERNSQNPQLISVAKQLKSGNNQQFTRQPRRISVEEQNRNQMLLRLQDTYRNLINQSLQEVTRLELGLAQKPDAVQNPTNSLSRGSRAEQHLPAGTSITQVYDKALHELLILGEPGVGKSTLLLHLAQELVKRAEQDQEHPLPVILLLSSWAIKRLPMQDWIAEQLQEVYYVPRKLSVQWVKEGCILPLLDGLDEMEGSAHLACITAINTYHREPHFAPPLAVCCRTSEHQAATVDCRLALQGAVVVQPLTRGDVDAYLVQAGKPLAALRRALKKNEALRDLATTPLMLHILILTYQGVSVRDLPKKEEALLQKVWHDYVRRMVESKGNSKRYPPSMIWAWLSYLARQMRDHNQSIFYLEHLQRDWLPENKCQQTYELCGVHLMGGLVGGLIGILGSLLFFYLSFTIDYNLTFTVTYALIGVLAGWLISRNDRDLISDFDDHKYPQHLGTASSAIPRRIISIDELRVGLLFGFTIGLVTLLSPTRGNEVSSPFIESLSNGISFGLAGVLLSIFLGKDKIAGRLAEIIAQLWMHTPNIVRLPRKVSDPSKHFPSRPDQRLLQRIDPICNGLCIGLVTWLSFSLRFVLTHGQVQFAFTYGLHNIEPGSFNGLSYGLSFGLLGILLSIFLKRMGTGIKCIEDLRWSWKGILGIRHQRNALLICFLYWLDVMLVHYWIPSPADATWHVLAEVHIVPLTFGLSFGLVYWLLLGFTNGVEGNELIKDDRSRPNQGIRLSLRHSLLIGVISCFVSGLGYAVSMGLAYTLTQMVSNASSDRTSEVLIEGLSYGYDYTLNYGLSSALIFGFSAGLLHGLLSGGCACLRHALLRWLLWRAESLPWSCVPFLNDASQRIFLQKQGGGYKFHHRLLQDYLASYTTLNREENR